MELTVGTIITGKVTSITKFGAFVALPDGKSGLVHISEVAGTFVSDVHDFLTEGQEVPVKVLSVSPEGKISLSVKQAQPPKPRPPHGERPARPRGPRPAPARSAPAQPAAVGDTASRSNTRPVKWAGCRPQRTSVSPPRASSAACSARSPSHSHTPICHNSSTPLSLSLPVCTDGEKSCVSRRREGGFDMEAAAGTRGGPRPYQYGMLSGSRGRRFAII